MESDSPSDYCCVKHHVHRRIQVTGVSSRIRRTLLLVLFFLYSNFLLDKDRPSIRSLIILDTLDPVLDLLYACPALRRFHDILSKSPQCQHASCQRPYNTSAYLFSRLSISKESDVLAFQTGKYSGRDRLMNLSSDPCR